MISFSLKTSSCGALILGAMFNLNGMELQQYNRVPAFIPEKLGKVELYRSNDGFAVLQNGKISPIKSYDTDKLLRCMTEQQLKTFCSKGYLALNQMSNNDFSLKAKVRGEGGGPILGQVAFWSTRLLGYGAFTLAVITTHGEALLHTAEANFAIETAAQAALVAGTLAPTP